MKTMGIEFRDAFWKLKACVSFVAILTVAMSATSYAQTVVDIYFNGPFKIPAFNSLAISPEILDKYVGVYSSPRDRDI